MGKKLRFEPLQSPEDVESPFNNGVGFALAVGSAAVLLFILVPLVGVALKLIGM